MKVLKKLAKGVLIFVGIIFVLFFLIIVFVPDSKESTEPSEKAEVEREEEPKEPEVSVVPEEEPTVDIEDESKNENEVSIDDIVMSEIQIEDYIDQPQIFIEYYELEPYSDDSNQEIQKYKASDKFAGISDMYLFVEEINGTEYISYFGFYANVLKDDYETDFPKLYSWEMGQVITTDMDILWWSNPYEDDGLEFDTAESTIGIYQEDENGQVYETYAQNFIFNHMEEEHRISLKLVYRDNEVNADEAQICEIAFTPYLKHLK